MTTAVVWERVIEITKCGRSTEVWSIEVTSWLKTAGVLLPSVELAHRLVSHICWDNNVAVTWKYLEKAMESRMVPPFLVLALLSTKVVPNRHPLLHPPAYSLYLHLLNTHAFSLSSLINSPNYPSLMNSIHQLLRLSQLYHDSSSYPPPPPHPGVVLVQFLFTLVWQLLQASLQDEALLQHKNSLLFLDHADLTMELDNHHHHPLHAKNTATAIQFIAHFLHNKLTSRILSLVQRNMSTYWGAFVDDLEQLAVNSLILRSLKHDVSPELFYPLNLKLNWPLSCESNKKMKLSSVLCASGSGSADQSHNDSSLWLPIDLILEDAMDGHHHVMAASAVELLTDLVKALQAVNATAWHNAFLGLWFAALRLVQRERDPSEGPVPRLDTCLCMLLCITTLVVANLIEEEEGELIEEAERSPRNQRKDKLAMGKRRGELVASLQLLGDYEDLLNPPQPVTWVANQAAAKATMFVSGHSGYLEYMNVNDLPTNCSGNLRHLIVEACIARHLIDTSAYFWPGYVSAPSNQLPRGIPNHLPSWSSLMKGSLLNPPWVNVLVATPASRYAAASYIIVGTYGYMAPEYATDGLFSIKSDVFSFGVLLLEIISGKKNRALSYHEEDHNLIGYAWRLWKEGIPLKLIDDYLRHSCIESEALRCIQIGLLCLQNHADDRPNMTSVVVMLSSENGLPKPKEPGLLIKKLSTEGEASSGRQTSSSTNMSILVTSSANFTAM